MRKKLNFVIVVIATLALFLLIGGSLSGDSLSLRMAPENKKIYIGVFEPLTGYNSLGGTQELLGLEYARSKRPTVTVNGATLDIEFVPVDNRSEPNSAAEVANNLLDSGVSAVLGSVGFAEAEAGAAVFAQKKLPFICISSANIATTLELAAFNVKTFSDSGQGGILANFAHGKGWRRVAVLTQAGDPYSKGLGQYFSAEFQRLGGEIMDFSFNSVQTNFEDLIDEISSGRVDCIFMPSTPGSGIVFINQARDRGLNGPFIGSDTWDVGAMVGKILDHETEIYISSSFSSTDDANAFGKAFGTEYASWVLRTEERREQNGGVNHTGASVALAYDAYMMLCDAIERGDSYAPALIAQSLAEMRYSGVSGEKYFSAAQSGAVSTAYIKTIDFSKNIFETVQTYVSKD